MTVRYLKRYHMEIDLRNVRLAPAVLPEGYIWEEWSPRLIGQHAAVNLAAFQGSPDSELFPRLSTLGGCRDLMRDIAFHDSFVTEAAWLIRFAGNAFMHDSSCGAIQGLSGQCGTGAIQNVGVVPEHQGQGLGRVLVLKALAGFQSRRIFRISLDVTASNLPAVHLYERIGFRRTQSCYKELPGLVPTSSVGFEMESL